MSQGQPPGVGASDGDQAIQLTDDRIREELSRVLASHEFRSSKRSQEFLRYVIENTLNGHADLLKERTIGIDVFGRPTSYDPSEDATVRVKAGEVRKRLGIYYSDQGAKNPIRIELPSGTYVPEFHANGSGPSALATTPTAPAPAVPGPDATGHRRMPVTAWLGAAVLLFGIVILVGYLVSHSTTTPLDEFWAPVVRGSSPVMLAASFVPVWNLDRQPGATGPPAVTDYVELTDQFVGGGDLIATSRLASMFTRMKRPYRLKVGNDVSFPDLRTGPAVLVGYSYTQWKEISNQLRYFIDGARRPVGITDNGKATGWALPNLPRDRRTSEDYAIVTRVFHPDTHAMLVELAGITQYGTDAAGDLVTNPDLMAEALHNAPRDWQKKNLQLVLHVKVIAGAPSSPQVVKSYFW